MEDEGLHAVEQASANKILVTALLGWLQSTDPAAAGIGSGAVSLAPSAVALQGGWFLNVAGRQLRTEKNLINFLKTTRIDPEIYLLPAS